jgi:hypothetical protein
MSEFTFAPATKEQAKARIALAGPSGSGKTFTSLLVAAALGNQVGLIDTERGSASKYADEFAFRTLQMQTFDPRDLVKALAAAAAAGHDVIVVDSLSHFWMGQGGMLEQVDNAAKRSYGGNSFGGWKEARPMERAMVDALLAYPGHVIVTMRTKTEWVIEENERGKKTPRKLGMKPEQRDGIEYEFDIVGDLDLENTLVVSKSRCRALAQAVIRRPDGDNFAAQVLTWLGAGAPVKTVADYLPEVLDPATSAERLRVLYAEAYRHQLHGAAVTDESGAVMTLAELMAAKGKVATEQEAKAAPAADETPGEAPAVEMATEKQLKRIHASFTSTTSREERLQFLGGVVGRELGSSKELTLADAGKVIDFLDQPAATTEQVAS